jgi:hypothetical protein
MSMKKTLLIVKLALFIFANTAFSQAPTTAYVNSPTVNVRYGPSVSNEAICSLKKGTKVEITGQAEKDEKNRFWYPVDFEDENGNFRSDGWIIGQFLEIQSAEGWDKTTNYTGSMPDCSNINPNYDYSMQNKLVINVQGNTDCIVKLYNRSDVCIRIAYIRSGDTYNMQNIPEGIYYLKIAYGNDYRKKVYYGNCYVKFMKNAQYKIGEQELDFRKKYSTKYEYGNEYRVTSFPSYSLSLSVINSYGNHLDTDVISEDEFNN